MYHWSWVNLIPGVGDDGLAHALGIHAHGASTAIASSWVVCLFLIALGVFARRGLDRARARGGVEQYLPETGFSARNVMEMYTGAILNMAEGMLGRKDAVKFFPLIGGLFIYIFCSNILSVLPGGLPPTDNISNNFAMGIAVFLVFNIAGIVRNGAGYIKHMAGPVWWLAWLILPIELVGVAVRPVSLSLRLMGNIVGDHTVFGIMSDLIPVVVPAVFLGLGIFVSFLQAFVFTLLSTIYIALSVAHDEEH
jgi:F-type H+-transporting ATPase subunit a